MVCQEAKSTDLVRIPGTLYDNFDHMFFRLKLTSWKS